MSYSVSIQVYERDAEDGRGASVLVSYDAATKDEITNSLYDKMYHLKNLLPKEATVPGLDDAPPSLSRPDDAPAKEFCPF